MSRYVSDSIELITVIRMIADPVPPLKLPTSSEQGESAALAEIMRSACADDSASPPQVVRVLMSNGYFGIRRLAKKQGRGEEKSE